MLRLACSSQQAGQGNLGKYVTAESASTLFANKYNRQVLLSLLTIEVLSNAFIESDGTTCLSLREAV